MAMVSTPSGTCIHAQPGGSVGQGSMFVVVDVDVIIADEVVVVVVTVVDVAPMHKHALEYSALSAQADAYAGILEAVTVIWRSSSAAARSLELCPNLWLCFDSTSSLIYDVLVSVAIFVVINVVAVVTTTVLVAGVTITRKNELQSAKGSCDGNEVVRMA